MEKNKLLHRIFAGVAVFVIGYYFVSLFFSATLPPESEKRDNRLLDAKTGQPIPSEEISRITERQEKNRVTYVLAGKVVEKSEGFLMVEISGDERTKKWPLRLRFSETAVFLKETPLPDFEKDMSAVEEKEISLKEVFAGDFVSIVFPKGVIAGNLKEAGVAQVGNLTVNLPRSLVQADE